MRAKVMSGEVLGVQGPIEAVVPTYYIDFSLSSGRVYEHPIPAGWNSMMVVHKGSFLIQGTKTALREGDCAAFVLSKTQEEAVRVQALEDDSRFVLLAGRPINEPIVRRGPFVLNTQEELEQAFFDY